MGGDAYSGPNWLLRGADPAPPGTPYSPVVTSSYPTWTNFTNADSPPACSSLPTLTGLSIIPSQVTSGNGATILVTLSSPAPAAGASINLSAGPANLSFSGACNIPAGDSNGFCFATAGQVATAAQVLVTATYYNC